MFLYSSFSACVLEINILTHLCQDQYGKHLFSDFELHKILILYYTSNSMNDHVHNLPDFNFFAAVN